MTTIIQQGFLRIESSQVQLFRHASRYTKMTLSSTRIQQQQQQQPRICLERKHMLFSSMMIPTSPRRNIDETDRKERTALLENQNVLSLQQQQPQPEETLSTKIKKRRLDVAIVGAPNAGKSQLLNVLTQSPIAAVSRKRHTTRSDILGARTIVQDDKMASTQIVFKDTPGFMKLENAKEERLDRDLIATAASELQHVDYTLIVVDAARSLKDNYRQALVQLMIGALHSKGRIEEDDDDDYYDDDDDEDKDTIVDNVDMDGKQTSYASNKSHTPIDNAPKFAIVLNKTDLVNPKSALLDLAMDIGGMADLCLEDQFQKHFNKAMDFDRKLQLSPIVFYVSALKEDGTDDILDHLVTLATPCRSWAVPPEQSTTLTPLEQVQEIIREKIYRCCHREVPHSVQQTNRLFRQLQQGLVIHQDLVVFSKSHQQLVQGTGRRTLQRIQDSAQRDLQKAFGCSVTLQLHVKLSKSKNRRDHDQGK
jgi:GTPase